MWGHVDVNGSLGVTVVVEVESFYGEVFSFGVTGVPGDVCFGESVFAGDLVGVDGVFGGC